MNELFKALKTQYEKKENCILAVVVAASGSTPREAGAYMLVNSAGRVWGTVGGGVTEYEATKQAQEQLKLGQSKLCHYDLSPAADKMCGGAQDILLYYVDVVTEASRAALAKVLEIAASGQTFWLHIPYEDGFMEAATKVKFDDKADADIAEVAQLKVEKFYIEKFNYDGTVYVFGGGHVAQELVPLLTHLDFRCIVLDDREEFANPGLFPNAVQCLQVNYENLEDKVNLTANDYACIMTRAHTYDAECERFALKSEVGYIGIMGSKHKAKLTREKLLREDFTEADISRVVTPIGISLPCETPAEIAISIAAQLIEVRVNKRLKKM